MFYQLTFLAITFFVTGAICLGGALMHIPTHEDRFEGVFDRIQAEAVVADKANMVMEKRLAREIAVVKQDSGEAKGVLDHRITALGSDLLRLAAKTDGMAVDLSETVRERAEELQRELNIWESQHRELEATVKKIGDDLYRHFTLQMKKPKGGRK